MIQNQSMRHIKRDGDLDFYIFTPRIGRFYYQDGKNEEWPVHQTARSHKLHLLFYMLHGGYRILYLVKNDEVVSYIVYTRCGRNVIRGTTHKDLYTVCIWTYPKFRKQGYSSILLQQFLHGIGLKDHAA